MVDDSTDTFVEKLARVLHEWPARSFGCAPPKSWEECTDYERRTKCSHAVAILRAARVPSEGMKQAGGDTLMIGVTLQPGDIQDAEESWQAMIDQALQEHEQRSNSEDAA